MLKPCDPSEPHTCPDLRDKDDAVTIQNKDLIGKLPDELLCLLVSKLKLRDAVKTTLLSRRWIHLLPSLHEFIFDRSRMFPQKKEDDDLCAQPWTDTFLKGVTQFLEFYQPPHIQCFGFSFCLRVEQADTIHGWVRLVLQKGAQKLRLEFCCDRCIANDAFVRDEDAYIFRSALLDSAKISLKELHLLGCFLELSPSFSDQFRQLRVLFLYQVVFVKDDLQDFLSCLTKLETLTLHNCEIPSELSLSSIHLKELDIKNSMKNQIIRKIVMPKVNLLRYHCFSSTTTTIDSRSLHYLNDLYYRVNEEGLHNVLASLPQFLPKLRSVYIAINSDIIWVKQLSTNMTAFSTVTEVLLNFVHSTEFCFSVLKAFPCLQRLIIWIDCSDDGDLLIRKSGEYEHKCLKEVTMSCCSPLRLAEFAIPFLEHASTVERLIIQKTCVYCAKEPLWDEVEQETMNQALQAIPKTVSVVIDE